MNDLKVAKPLNVRSQQVNSSGVELCCNMKSIAIWNDSPTHQTGNTGARTALTVKISYGGKNARWIASIVCMAALNFENAAQRIWSACS